MQLTLKYTFFGKIINNIEFVKTFIVLLQIQSLEKKILKTNGVKFHKKLLVFI